jgi:hypothetical protein
LLDGEVVALRDGLPNLAWLLRRHHLANPWQVRWAWRWCPVRYVLFDVLYWAGHSLLAEPFRQRHERLAEVENRLQAPEVLTAFVCGDRTGTIREDELETGRHFHNPYERSKCEAERRVRSVNDIKATVYRPESASLPPHSLVLAFCPITMANFTVLVSATWSQVQTL